MKKLLLAVAACSVLSAQAAAVSFTFDLPLVRDVTEIDGRGTLGLFDSSLGTLTGATFDIFGQAAFAFSGTNRSSRSQTASLNASTTLTFVTSLGALSPLLPAPLMMAFSSSALSYGVTQTRSFGPSVQDTTASSNLNSILASLQQSGGGNFGIDCASDSGLAVIGGGGNISTTQDTTAGCGARITYVFDAAAPPPPPPPTTVPEPGSVALIGLALAGMAFVRRKNKKS